MENNFEKKLELCLAKLNKECDLDWSEIAEELGLDCSSDHLRKTAYGIKECFDYLTSKTHDELYVDELEKLNEKIFQLKIEKQKLTDLKTYVNKKCREYSREDNMNEILREKLDSLPQQMINNDYVSHETSHKQGICVWSDWHYGETVDIFLNKYDSDICKKRVNYLVNKTIEYSQLNNIDILNVFLLGDLISNEHYTTIRLSNRENTMEQIIQVSELVSEAILKLSKYVPYVIVGVCTGNHERKHQKNENLNKDNYTTLIKEFVMLRLKNISNIAFLENSYDNEIINANICGLNVIGTHGDKTNKQQSSYQLSSLLNQKIDLLIVGHYHELATQVQHETTVIRNGSLVGSNEYSRNMNLHTRPCQRLLIVSNDGVDCVYDIKLDKIEDDK